MGKWFEWLAVHSELDDSLQPDEELVQFAGVYLHSRCLEWATSCFPFFCSEYATQPHR